MRRKLDYGQVGGKGLSHSRLCTAHLCLRKFQLENILHLKSEENNIDFAFGHAVGAGVQALVENPDDINSALLETFAAWDMPLHEEQLKGKKSVWYSIRAIEYFYAMITNPATNLLREYEIAKFVDKNGKEKSAVELTFKIDCFNDYIYEGHIDLVLKHKKENLYIILELKTTKFNNIHDALFKNSSQALGYSIVLDSIVSDINARNAYQVFYLIYKTGQQEYEPKVFHKTRVQRAQFINSLVMDIQILELCKDFNFYPMNGESCFNFFKPCKYFGICTLNDEVLKEAAGGEDEIFTKLKEYDFIYSLADIKKHQEQILKEELIAHANIK